MLCRFASQKYGASEEIFKTENSKNDSPRTILARVILGNGNHWLDCTISAIAECGVAPPWCSAEALCRAMRARRSGRVRRQSAMLDSSFDVSYVPQPTAGVRA
jgi:hypothetical protein